MNSTADDRVRILAVTPSVAADWLEVPATTEANVTAVTTANEGLRRIRNDGFDCILSDGELPDADGVSFLEIVRTQAPTIPFFLVSADEPACSRAIAAGATGCLAPEQLRTSWKRVRSLCTDAVSMARRREELGETPAQTQAALDAAHDPIAIVQDGRYEHVNRRWLEFFGASKRDEFLGAPVTDAIAATTVSLSATQFRAGEGLLECGWATARRSEGPPTSVEVTAAHIEWCDSPAVVATLQEDSGHFECGAELQERALDAAPIGITIADARRDDMPLIYVNEGFERLTGYDESEVLGRNCRFLQGKETAPAPVAKMREAIDAKEAVTVELRNYRKDGELFWNRVSIAPIADETGVVTHYVGFQQDVTERKQRAREYRRFEQAVEHAGHAITITDRDGRIEYVNPAFEDVTGYTEQDALGTNPRILKSGNHDEEFYEELWETILGGDVWHSEIVNERKDGERIVVDQTIAPVLDENGDIDRFVGVYRDVTDRKERERELELFRNAVEQAGNAVMITDRVGIIEYVNEAFERQTGYTREEAVGRTPNILKSGQQDETFYEELWRTILAGEQWEAELVNQRKSGELYAVDQTIAPLSDDGEITHFVAIESDITARRLREQRLAVLNRILRHNLRNALTLIEGHARELTDSLDDPDRRAAAATIREQSTSLAQISEKATTMNELLQRDYDPPPTCDLGTLLEDLVPDLRDQHPQATITAEWQSQTVRVSAAPDALRLAIEEAVENAVVHNDRPSPAVHVTLSEPSDSSAHVTVSIADDGPGLPEHEREVIEDGVETQLVHGDAIGLWTIRWVATVFGGEVSISENEPRGSVVTLTFPTADEERLK